MTKKVKAIARYVIMIMVTAFLLWLSFSNIQVSEGESKTQFISAVWASADKPLLFLSGLLALLSHMIRAERWKMLLAPLGYRANFRNSFLSVMVGYFVNLAIPRGGEVSRCYNLYKLDQTPINISIGTVMAERIIDLLFLCSSIGIAFVIEWDSFTYFFQSINLEDKETSEGSYDTPMLLAGAFVILLAGGYLFFRLNKTLSVKLWGKIRNVMLGVKDGLTSVFALKKKGIFIFYSILIWLLYYLMSYSVMLAFEETQDLGLMAALSIFVIGGVAMAVPLPGGAGSYHELVPLGLVVLYNLQQDKAVAFTFIFHGWQTLIVIIVGAISLFWSQTMFKQHANSPENIGGTGS